MWLFACFDVNIFPQMLNSDGFDMQMQQKCCFLAAFRLIFGIMFTKIATVVIFCDREVQFLAFCCGL